MAINKSTLIRLMRVVFYYDERRDSTWFFRLQNKTCEMGKSVFKDVFTHGVLHCRQTSADYILREIFTPHDHSKVQDSLLWAGAVQTKDPRLRQEVDTRRKNLYKIANDLFQEVCHFLHVTDVFSLRGCCRYMVIATEKSQIYRNGTHYGVFCISKPHLRWLEKREFCHIKHLWVTSLISPRRDMPRVWYLKIESLIDWDKSMKYSYKTRYWHNFSRLTHMTSNVWNVLHNKTMIKDRLTHLNVGCWIFDCPHINITLQGLTNLQELTLQGSDGPPCVRTLVQQTVAAMDISFEFVGLSKLRKLCLPAEYLHDDQVAQLIPQKENKLRHLILKMDELEIKKAFQETIVDRIIKLDILEIRCESPTDWCHKNDANQAMQKVQSDILYWIWHFGAAISKGLTKQLLAKSTKVMLIVGPFLPNQIDSDLVEIAVQQLFKKGNTLLQYWEADRNYGAAVEVALLWCQNCN